MDNKLNYVYVLLIGVLVIGLIGYGLYKNKAYENTHKKECIVQLGKNLTLMDYCLNEVNNIPINLGYNSSYYFKKDHNRYALFFYPNETGNYTVATVNFILKINNTLPVCLYEYRSCDFFTNMTIDEICSSKRFYVFYNQTEYIVIYSVPTNVTLPIILEIGNKTEVYKKGECIYIEGTRNTIRQAVDRFIYWWYGFG